MTSQTATTFWDIPHNLKFEEPIDESSPFFVDTAAARGHFSFNGIYKSLFLDPVSMSFKSTPPKRVYQLFLGHRGCGKSTELRRLSHKLHHPARFFVIFLDAYNELDKNNLGYADILLALAASLLTELDKAQINLSDNYIKPLSNWFGERIESHEQTKDYAAEIKSGVQAKGGLPFLAELFTSITTSFRINSTYKEQVRMVLANSFSQFASAFNVLLAAAEEAIIAATKGHSLLFIIDGTDRLNQEDSRRFFINEAHQLQQIEGNFIYCAPIQLANEEGQVNEAFKTFILPMVKVREKTDPAPLPDAYQALRKLVYQRIAANLFDAPTTVDYLIEHSGGNPRHLIRLLDYAFQDALGESLDLPAAEKAVKHLANDLRRVLNTEDYALLARIDTSDNEVYDHNVRRLVYNSALLEYDNYWRLSHPVIRTLFAYQNAISNIQNPLGFEYTSLRKLPDYKNDKNNIKISMGFNFTNFGYIDNGVVELADLTIICGPNNVGKTYISHAIYGFFKYFKNLVELHLEKSKINELQINGAIQIDLSFFSQQIQTSFSKASEKFTSKLEIFFNAPDKYFSKTKIQFTCVDYKYSFTNATEGTVQFGSKNPSILRFVKLKDEQMLSITLQISDNSKIPEIVLRDIISEHIAWHLFTEKLPEPFVITSERTGISLFYKELDISKNVMINQISGNNDMNSLELLNSIRSRYAEPIKDNIDIVRDYENSSKSKSFMREEMDNHKHIFEALQDLLGGSFSSVDKQVFYQPKADSDRDKVLIPVYLASSSVKSIFLFDYYINCLANKNNLLIIDEPELNLHPDNQKKMAKLLIRLVNSGVKVIITTHSDYLIKEVNNCIMLNNDIENKSEIMKESGYIEEDILHPEKVAAYSLGNTHSIDKVKIDMYGIDMTIFDELISETNQISDNIYYNIKE